MIYYLIKSICKILLLIVKKKFPDEIKVERNKFLANFFFHSLFLPSLLSPSLDNTLMNEFVISNSTMNSLQKMMPILNNITLGNFFEKNFYTPFNMYILEKMPKLISFFDNVCEVTLPPFIEQLINDNLPQDYKYDYLKKILKKIFYIEIYALILMNYII